MNISQLLQLQNKKAQLQKKKQKLLKKELHKKKLEQINLDNSSVKKGYIEKTKIIKKKQFEVIHEKARTHIPIEIQENATVSSYLINNENYKKVYQRTKKIIAFGEQRFIENAISALKAYGIEHKQKILHLKLIFEKEIDCGSVIRPFKLNLPNKNLMGNKNANNKNSFLQAIILVKDARLIEKTTNFKSLGNESISVKQYSEFVKQFKNDKNFRKNILHNRILILCQWQIYKSASNKFIQNLLDKNLVVFPLDIKKVPYYFSQNNNNMNYIGYIKNMIQNEYALIKSGKQHTVHLKLNMSNSVQQTIENVKQAVIQMVAKLIERNKDKTGNYLIKAQAKTNTSINFVLYQRK